MLMLGGVTSVQAGKLTVHVDDSKNQPLSGVTVEVYESSYNPAGTTSAKGETTYNMSSKSTYKVRLTYAGTTYESAFMNLGNGQKADTFRTSELKVVAQSAGQPVAGISIQCGATTVGTTGANGEKSIEIFPSNGLKVKTDANGTCQTQTVASFPYGTKCTTIVFSNLVKLQSPNTYFQVGSPVVSVNSGYLFPGTYPVLVNKSYPSNVTVSGPVFDKIPCVIVVKNHIDNPIQGSTLRGGYGIIPNGGGFAWHGPATESNGVAIDWVDNGSKIVSYEARVNGTTFAQSQDITTTNGSVFTFKTNELSLNLQDCAGVPVAGGTARYGIGSEFGTWYFPGTDMATGSDGKMSMEAFPGTYSFEMRINQSREVKQIVFTGTNGLTWTTTKVTLDWPYAVAFGGDGNSDWFPNKAGTEMLPGTYNFRFDGPYGSGSSFAPITVSGCSVNKFAVAVRLIKSDNSPIANAQPYCNGIGMPVTNESGNSIVLMDANPYSVITKMFYEGAEEWKQEDNPAVNRIITFQTVEVTVDLKAANQVVYFRYTPTWGYFGTTGDDGKVKKQLLPTDYEFTPAYNTGLRAYQNVKYNPFVSFGSMARMSQSTLAPAAFSFFPNPAVNSLNISMPAAGTVEILSIDGRKLAQHQVAEGNTTIDVSSLPAGNHLMIVHYNGNTETHKFVKQ
jgi:hypothetical protein